MEWKTLASLFGVNAITIVGLVWYLSSWRSTTDQHGRDIGKMSITIDKHSGKIQALEEQNIRTEYVIKDVTDKLESIGVMFDMWQKNNMKAHELTNNTFIDTQKTNRELTKSLLGMIDEMRKE